MSSYFNCAAYDDVDTTIRLSEHVVFLVLKVKGKDTDIHVTLNPLQVRTLAKYLSLALTQIDFTDLKDEKYFGDLSVQIELDNPPKLISADKIYDNNLMYVQEEDSIAVPF